MSIGNLRRFGILSVLAYVALSWAARFDMALGVASLVYPLDTFSMYAGSPGNAIGHLVVRDAVGGIHGVRDFAAYRCDAELKRGATRCRDLGGFAYHYDDLVRYIDDHRGSGATAVDLVYRTWHLEPREPPSVEADCVIADCMVAP